MVKRLVLEKADRLYHMPSVIDEFLPRRKKRKIIRQNVLDLARFEWPKGLANVTNTNSFHPAGDDEIEALQTATAAWYQGRFGSKINPAKEIFIGDNIRQLINLLALVYFNPGDMILVPDPGVWHYRAAVALASAETVPYHLVERNHFKPAISTLSESLTRLAKAIFVNSPQNPTGQIYTKEDLSEILHTAGRENLLIIMDQAFEGFIDDIQPASIFALPGGRKVGLELYSYAYNFGQPHPAPAFAIGQPALISSLRKMARIFGLSLNNQQILAGQHALKNHQDIDRLTARHNENRQLLDQLCQRLRLFPANHRTGPFYWAKLPGRKQSQRFCRQIYLRCGILAVPGIAFGENGEGYIRFSLTAETDVYRKAIEAAQKLLQLQRKKTDG